MTKQNTTKKTNRIKKGWEKVKTFPGLLAFAISNHPFITLGFLIIGCTFVLLLVNFSCDSDGAKMEPKIKLEKKL